MSSTRRLGRTLAWTVSGVLGLGLVAGAAAGIAEARSATQAAPAAAAAAGAASDPGPAGPHGRMGRLGRHVVHGEFVVKAKDGYRTVAVQRGTVTSRDGNTVVVTSPDGSAPETWTLTGDTKVRKDRAKGSLTDITPGAHLMLVGPKSGDTRTARLVVIRTAAAPGGGPAGDAGA